MIQGKTTVRISYYIKPGAPEALNRREGRLVTKGTRGYRLAGFLVQWRCRPKPLVGWMAAERQQLG